MSNAVRTFAMAAIMSSFLSVGIARATWTSDSTLNLAVAPGTHMQVRPSITSDGMGGAYVAWEDDGAVEPTAENVWIQHVTSTGGVDPAWPATGMVLDPTSTEGNDQSLINDSRHGVIVGWLDYAAAGVGFRVQRFDSSGARLWGNSGERLVTVTNDGPTTAQFPEIQFVADSAQGAIGAWLSIRYSNTWTNVFVSRIDRNGALRWTPDGVRVCPGDWDQRELSSIADGAGGVITAWTDKRYGWPRNPEPSIYAQRLDNDGNLLWTSLGVAVCTYPTGVPSLRGLCSDGQGGAFLSWRDLRSHPNGDVYLQHLLGSGNLDPVWPAGGMVIDSISSYSGGAGLVADGSGGVQLLWYSQRAPYNGYFAQHVTAGGIATWTYGGVYVGSAISSGLAQLPDARGGYIYTSDESPNVVTCPSNDRLLARRVASDGTTPWGSLGTIVSTGCGSRRFPAVCSDSANGMIAAWEEYNVPSTGWNGDNVSNIHAQRIRADGTLGGDVVDALLSLAGADATSERVSLRWFTSDRAISGAEVERNAGDGWARIAHVAPDGSGLLVYEDANIVAGRRYGYRLSVTLDGRTSAMGETWVMVPAGAEFSLRSVQPNPSGGALTVSFTLPGNSPATLELLDVAGRRVAQREVGALGAGAHVVSFSRETSVLKPGVYSVRLRATGRTASLRAVVIR